MNFGGLQCLFESKGRKDRRHALGQHGFAGAGRADHQNVVAAGRGHFQRALGGLLSAHIFEVDGKLLRLRQRGCGIRRQRRDAIGAIQQSDNFHQRLHRIDADAGDHRRLAGVGFRHDEVHDLVAARGNGDGQRAAHPAHPAIERKFAHQDVVAQFFFIQRTVGAEDAQRHRQVEARTFFLYIRGREVDGDLRGRNVVAAIAQRRTDALAALAHRRIGQPDGVEVVFRGANAGDIDLNFDDRRVYAVHGGAESFEEHEWRSISEAVVSRQSSVLS